MGKLSPVGQGIQDKLTSVLRQKAIARKHGFVDADGESGQYIIIDGEKVSLDYELKEEVGTFPHYEPKGRFYITVHDFDTGKDKVYKQSKERGDLPDFEAAAFLIIKNAESEHAEALFNAVQQDEEQRLKPLIPEIMSYLKEAGAVESESDFNHEGGILSINVNIEKFVQRLRRK